MNSSVVHNLCAPTGCKPYLARWSGYSLIGLKGNDVTELIKFELPLIEKPLPQDDPR